MFRADAIFNAIMFSGPAVLGLAMAILLPIAFGNPMGFAWFTILLYVVGLALFVTAKLSLYRQDLWLSWGPASMSPGYRWMYRIGYCLMGLGLLSTLALAVATRMV